MSWDGDLPPNYVRTGCSLMHGIQSGEKLLLDNQADIFIVSGKDYNKAGFKENPEQQRKLFEIYGPGKSPLTEYVKVTERFINYHQFTLEDYKHASHRLFENYLRTWKALHPIGKLPDKRWFEYLNPFFRGVDCANPYIDFHGAVVFATKQAADACDIPKHQRVRVLGSSLQQSNQDGTEDIDEIVPYKHLKKAFDVACNDAQVDFKTRIYEKKTLCLMFIHVIRWLHLHSYYPQDL